MSRFVYLFGVALLWLAAGCGALWWIRAAFAVYETLWALTTSLVVLAPLLFATHVVHRVWRWVWAWSNGEEAMDPSATTDLVPPGPPSPDAASTPSSPACLP